MNERMRELADEAGLRFTQLMSNPMVPVVDGKETDLKKFAELIVRECIEISNQHPSKIFKKEWDADAVAWDITQRIKGRFGVEE